MVVEPTLDLTPVAPPPSPNRSRRRSIAVIVVLVAAILVLLSHGILHSLNYYETVDQVATSRSSIGTKVIRLEGVVKPHSITRTANGASFWITGSGTNEFFVVAKGTPPELFEADIPVVVQGHFASATSSTFDGTQILVKHTSSYIAAHPSRVRAPNGSVR